jgi:hypothetical protein
LPKTFEEAIFFKRIFFLKCLNFVNLVDLRLEAGELLHDVSRPLSRGIVHGNTLLLPARGRAARGAARWAAGRGAAVVSKASLLLLGLALLLPARGRAARGTARWAARRRAAVVRKASLLLGLALLLLPARWRAARWAAGRAARRRAAVISEASLLLLLGSLAPLALDLPHLLLAALGLLALDRGGVGTARVPGPTPLLEHGLDVRVAAARGRGAAGWWAARGRAAVVHQAHLLHHGLACRRGPDQGVHVVALLVLKTLLDFY